MFALLLAASFVVMRSTTSRRSTHLAHPRSRSRALLAVADWYGSGNLGPADRRLTLAWTAATSVLVRVRP